MENYIANMDIQIDGKLFHESELITANIREKDASFLLEHGMIRKKNELEQVELEKKEQESVEPEHVESEKKEPESPESEKKSRKQGSKSGNSKDAK